MTHYNPKYEILVFLWSKKNFEKAEVQLLNQGTSAMNLKGPLATLLSCWLIR